MSRLKRNEAQIKFEYVDSRLKSLAARLLTIGDVLLYRTEHAGVSNMPSEFLDEIIKHEDMAIIDADALDDVACLENLVTEWHRAKKELKLS